MERGILVVQTSPTAGREQEFHDFYVNVHIPEVLESSGMVAARRYWRLDEDGAGRRVGTDGWLLHLAVYDVEADDLAAAYADVLERTLTRNEAVSAASYQLYRLLDLPTLRH